MKRRLTTLLITIISLSMLLPLTQPIARASGPPYSWTGPTDIDPHFGQDNLPAATQASNGTLWLAWQTFRFSSSRPDIIYLTFTNNTKGSIGRITSTGYNTTPALVELNGKIMLFWGEKKTTSFTIYYESFTGPSTWSSPQNATVISTSYDDTAPSAITTHNGALWLFWERDNQSCTTTCVVTKQIYYKTMTSGIWSSETRITSDTNWNALPSAVVTKDSLIKITWAKGGQGTSSSSIYYKTYNGTVPSNDVQLVSPPSGFADSRPSMIQDRNGTMWLFWARTSLTAPMFVLYSKFSTNNGQSWSSETQMTNEASGIDSQQPAAVQGNSKNDKVIHLFYASDRTNNDFDIWSLTSPSIAPVHDVGITNVYTSGTWWYSGGMTDIGENSNVTFSFTAVNFGDYGENVQATASVSNKTVISLGSQTQPVSLGNSWTFFFSWNTTRPDGSNVPAGRYNILINIVSTNGTETPANLADNSVAVKNGIRLVPWGDMDQDGNVNLQDVSVFVYDYGFTPATPSRWCAVCDITGTGIIGLQDVSIAVKNFGIVS